MSQPPTDPHTPEIKTGPLAAWNRLPLFARILIGMAAGIAAGSALGEKAWMLKIPSTIILRVLGALAPPLILIAVVHVLLNTELKGRIAWRMAWLLLLNTIVAIVIGLGVANLVRPGERTTSAPPPPIDDIHESDPRGRETLELLKKHGFKLPDPHVNDPLNQLMDNVPKSLFGPLGDEGSVIGVIFIAIAFGIALRAARQRRINTVGDLVEICYQSLLVVLHWVIALVPLGVFGIVANIVGTQGFTPFIGLSAFIFAVILGLALQAVYYLVRVRLGTWVRPLALVRGCRDALVMAFSTGSSTATMPVTYSNLRDRVGLREESASLGALVGTNFNNDGTALYEAMSALFVSQILVTQGRMLPLSISQQCIVMLTSIIASIGAAGIPEAGLVTMTLVFKAVGLPPDQIALLLTVDWFLDRCRTAINVMGDMNVSCMLDGRTREERKPVAAITVPTASPVTVPAMPSPDH
jgi:Na+/H+-dicarboxylate symporter